MMHTPFLFHTPQLHLLISHLIWIMKQQSTIIISIMLNWTTIQNNDPIIQASNSMMHDCWNEVISQNSVWFTKGNHSYTERSFLCGKWPNIRHFHITKPNNEVRLGIRTKMNGNVTNHLSHEKRKSPKHERHILSHRKRNSVLGYCSELFYH